MGGGALVGGREGFFAWHNDSSELNCNNIANSQCRTIQILGAPGIGVAGSGNIGFASRFETQKDVDHWGLALEVATPGPTCLKGGLAFRQIDQDTTITGGQLLDGVLSDPYSMTYNEDLETNYWGAYIGSVLQASIGNGVMIFADGEIGLYWMDADYNGQYTSANSRFFPASNTSQSLGLSRDEIAAIAAVKLSLEQDLGIAKPAVFGRGEWISEIPEVRFNTVALPPVVGPTTGTSLGEDDAFSLSVGGRITVPMGGR